MEPKASRHSMARRLAMAIVIAGGVAAGACERRPRDPKPPSDPGHNVPKPITANALPVLTVLPAPAPGR
jgi:hypothetical protein